MEESPVISVVKAPPRPAAPSVPRAAVQPATRLPRLDLSAPAYWLLAGVTILAYLALWATHFHHVYGWIMDDRILYLKGLDTVRDWRAAFEYANALQTYFWLVTQLPLRSGLSLPSYPVPTFGEQTGQFRFLLLYMVLLHAGLLATWAWFAAALSGNRLAALLSLVLFATSPTLLLWSPQPESRLLGLPFTLVGVWWLLRLDRAARPGPRLALLAFGAGSLFGIAQSIHYTALYLIGPICVAYWGLWLWRRWRRAAYWLALACFLLGCLWLQALLEAISDFGLGIPLEQGPTMALLGLRTQHTSPWSTAGNLSIFAEGFLSQLGPLLLVAVVVGWLLYLRRGTAGTALNPLNRLVVGLSIPLALLYVGLSGSMPFFRQTSVLQPFLFLFAGLAVVQLASWAAGRARLAALSATALLLLVGAVQWGQAHQVFEAHLGLGRALEWAYAHKGDRPLAWLPVAWFGGSPVIASPAELDQATPDTWVVSYFPWSTIAGNPSLQPSLAAATVAAWPSLYATDTVRMEHKGYGYNDFRYDPLLRDVRILDVASIRRAQEGQPLEVAAVDADSVGNPTTEPLNVFDRDRSPDASTAWGSAPTLATHWLAVQFAAAVPLGALQVVLPIREQMGPRIAALTIQALDADGQYRTIWTGTGLQTRPVIDATWEPSPTRAIRLVVGQEVLPTGADRYIGEIEELSFPGYRVAAPPPTRAFPALVLQEVRSTEKGLLVTGTGLTSQTVLLADDTVLPLRRSEDGWLARIDDTWRERSGPRQLALTDELRYSNALTVRLGPPVLQRLEPLASSPRPDSYAVLVDTDDILPGTVAVWDSTTLETIRESEHRLLALVPVSLAASPGLHTIYLKNVFGPSAPLPIETRPRPQ